MSFIQLHAYLHLNEGLGPYVGVVFVQPREVQAWDL
jgi:hypothetical protein